MAKAPKTHQKTLGFLASKWPLSLAFESAKLNGEDSQITDFFFCSASFGKNAERMEFILMGEACVSKTHGLYISVSLEAHLCNDDSTDRVFTKKLNAAESLSTCAQKSPLTHVFALHPDWLARILAKAPQDVVDALHAHAAKELADELDKNVKPASVSKIPKTRI